jgi:phage tail-like protein
LADRLPGQGDLTLPPKDLDRASEDPLAIRRVDTPAHPDRMETLEWLIQAPPGRYLWLRIRLGGTSRRGPSLFGIRATFPRPSMLDFLPAYWRSDAEGADATERALALFESFTTQMDQGIDSLVHLFDPDLVPADALPWLASFMALTFDDRIGESVRRQLLSEIAILYRQRGTLPGLTRLLSILAQARVQIVEGYRLRRPTAAFIDESAVGPGLEIGGGEGALALLELDPWEQALVASHGRLRIRRAMDDSPCPAEDPPVPFDESPLMSFYRRHAHRFTVILPIPCDAELESVIELATEMNKPAHTIHRLCWIDTGYRIGSSSLVGISSLGEATGPTPAVLGEATLTTFTTIHHASDDRRYRTFHT